MEAVSCSRPKKAMPIPAMGTNKPAGGTNLRICGPTPPNTAEMSPVTKLAARATLYDKRNASSGPTTPTLEKYTGYIMLKINCKKKKKKKGENKPVLDQRPLKDVPPSTYDAAFQPARHLPKRPRAC